MMQESKLTNFQQRTLGENMRSKSFNLNILILIKIK